MKVLDRLFGRPVYHRVQRKNRRGALLPCTGVAFYTRSRHGVPLNEIPLTCETCGQPIQTRHLDWSSAMMDAVPVPSRTAPRIVVMRAPERALRYHGPKGTPVTEVKR